MSANDDKNNITRELYDIAQELDNIASELAANFDNVGNDQCSQCVYNIAYKLRQTTNSISNVDLSALG